MIYICPCRTPLLKLRPPSKQLEQTAIFARGYELAPHGTNNTFDSLYVEQQRPNEKPDPCERYQDRQLYQD